MTRANDVLNTCRRVVVVGASPDPKRYGHEVLEAFHAAGYDVAAVNPKYESSACTLRARSVGTTCEAPHAP